MAIDVHEVFANYFEAKSSFSAAIYAVSQKLEQGHICLEIKAYNDALSDPTSDGNPFLQENQFLDESSIKNNKIVGTSTDDNLPFIYHDGRLYLHRYYNYQSLIHEKLNTFVVTDPPNQSNHKRILDQLKDKIELLFGNQVEVDWQKIASLSVLLNNMTIISGGPGTGKTTTVAKILTLLYKINPDYNVALCAPTGKAAARMKESLTNSYKYLKLSKDVLDAFNKIQVSTIQRLLGFQRNSIYFRHNKDNPLPFDLIIVDEASMISAALMSKLLQAIPPHKKLIMLGDKFQLSSIEAGSIFGDLCALEPENCFSIDRFNLLTQFASLPHESIFHPNKSKTTPLLLNHIITLQKSYRFDELKGIGKLAKDILNNKIDISSLKKAPTNESEFVFFSNDYHHDFLNKYINYYKNYIQEKDWNKVFKALNKIRILCAVREGKHGIYHYNNHIEAYLTKKKLIKVEDGFYHNQPIMITKNDYSHDLFNGDVGVVRRDKNNRLRAYFEDDSKTVKSVTTAVIESYETVFAMTIHKSQGSEFDHVVIILPESENQKILSRQLLYTAVTRAKKEVFIMGSDEQLQNAAKNKVQRASGLADLLILNED